MMRVVGLWVLASIGLTTLVAAAEPKVAERWAVLIGVDDYANANDLQFCGADQSALRERLIASGFRPESVILLHDQAGENKYKPSRGNIEQQLRLVISSAEADDLLVVGFSGHGVSLGGKSYLCPSDATLSDPATLISLDGVYEQLRNCAARFKWVLVDACRNDPTLGGARSFSATDGTKQLARSLQELKLPEGVVLLNSCAPGEISWEEQKFGHGVYMHYVLEALSGGGDADGDGHVSLNELQRYASGRTKSYVIGKFNQTQRPFSRSEGEAEAMDFALLPVRGAGGLPGFAPPAIPNNVPPRNVITNSIGMKLTLIPAGEFLMGAADSDSDADDDEKPQHRVRITQPFYLGTYAVTQGHWQAVMGTTPWSGKDDVREGSNYPATFVNWDDAQEFCRKLSEREGKTYRLPTEAEWEYACRAGTTMRYSFGNDESSLSDYGWWGGESVVRGNAANETYAHAVGLKRPNPWGLYDMHGNVYEWCDDWYDSGYYATARSDDPSGYTTGNSHVQRGGGWHSAALNCRSSFRDRGPPSYVDGALGFRAVLVP